MIELDSFLKFLKFIWGWREQVTVHINTPIHWVTPQVPRSQELNPCFPRGWQKPFYRYYRMLPPRVCVNRKLEPEVMLGLSCCWYLGE